MTKLIQTAIALVMLTLAGKTYAALIEYNGYTLDESTNIVTGGGLEWLQWDVTVGMNINTALADIADGIIGGVDYGIGWSLASNVQMSSLFNAFDFGAPFIWDGDEQTVQSLNTGSDGAIEDITTDAELQFTAILGETESFAPESSNPVSISRALFGNDLDGDLLYNLALVTDDFQSEGGIKNGGVQLLADNYEASFPDHRADSTGVALVRDVSPSHPTRPVSEPSVLALFVIGLIGMMRLRRRNTKSTSTVHK